MANPSNNITRKLNKRFKDSEINILRIKDKADLDIVICYPNSHYLGTSNLGFLSIYRYLNEPDDIRCERFYFEDQAYPPKKLFQSFETKKSLKDFDCIAFSLSYELDLVNVIKILSSSGIPVYSEERTDEHPYVIMGGIVPTINPEPAAPFIDTFVLGDGEEVTIELLRLYLSFGKKQFEPEFLKTASNIEGVYFPATFNPKKDILGNFVSWDVKDGFPKSISRHTITDINEYKTFSPIISPDTSFSSCCLIDVIRGCRSKCRFCITGNICSPLRYRRIENIEAIITEMKEHTNKFGLIAPSLTDYPDIDELINLKSKYNIQLSVASLRIDSINEELLNLLSKTDQKTITLAPEAGSEKLRKMIGKPRSDQSILDLIQQLMDVGILNYKLYFMVGLPKEQQEDIEGIIYLIKNIKHIMLKKAKSSKRIGELSISASCFVPKPQTPFENCAMNSLNDLKAKISFLGKSVSRIDNVSFTSDVPKWARIQGMISKGDRMVGHFLKKVVDLGGNFSNAFKIMNINPDYYLEDNFDDKSISPWNHIRKLDKA
jgi:radical SAM superfamily enzyme YgiQ (UPF0313 family)